MSLKNVLINMVTTLMMSAKISAVGLLKKKVFWNYDYEMTADTVWEFIIL